MKQFIEKIKSSKVTIVLVALFVAFGLLLSLNIVELGKAQDISGFQKIIIKIDKSIEKDTLKSIIIFGFTYFLLRKKYKNSNNIFKIILAVLFSLFMVFGYSYAKTNSWDLIFHGKLQFAKALIVMCSYYIIFKLMINYIFEYVVQKIKYKSTENKLFNYIFEKHSFILPLLIILVCWLPYVIIFYPGIMGPDSSNQIKQFFGMTISETSSTNSVNLIDENVKITNHHPVLHTVFLGVCVKIGKFIGNDNLGIFLYTIIQVILMSSALAYIINFMKKLKTNNYIRTVALIIFAVFPIFPVSTLYITKDIAFTSMLLIYICELYKIIKDYEKEKISKKRLILIIFLSLMVCLFRNNGIYTILLSLPFAAIANKLNRKNILFATLIVFILYESFIKILLPALKIPNTGVREMLSVPFQQTARYVKEYENEVTEEEKEKIDKILNYETLSSRYDPQRSDNVKKQYNKDATGEDLKNYFQVWFKQFLKHPNVYIESFINNYYGYFYLDSKVIEYTTGRLVNNDPSLLNTGKFNYKYKDEFKNYRKTIAELININRDAPVISWYTNMGLNTWVILGILTYLIYKKKYKYIVYIMPCIITLLVCCVSPVNAYFRYLIPNIFGLPLIISIFFDIMNNSKEEELNGEKNSSNNTML